MSETTDFAILTIVILVLLYIGVRCLLSALKSDKELKGQGLLMQTTGIKIQKPAKVKPVKTKVTKNAKR